MTIWSSELRSVRYRSTGLWNVNSYSLFFVVGVLYYYMYWFHVLGNFLKCMVKVPLHASKIAHVLSFGVKVFCNISIKFQCFHGNVTFSILLDHILSGIFLSAKCNRILYSIRPGLTKIPMKVVRGPVTRSFCGHRLWVVLGSQLCPAGLDSQPGTDLPPAPPVKDRKGWRQVGKHSYLNILKIYFNQSKVPSILYLNVYMCVCVYIHIRVCVCVYVYIPFWWWSWKNTFIEAGVTCPLLESLRGASGSDVLLPATTVLLGYVLACWFQPAPTQRTKDS